LETFRKDGYLVKAEYMINRKIDEKKIFQVVIDIGWQKILLNLRAETGRSIKSLVEDALSNTYGIDKDGKPYKLRKPYSEE